MAHLVMYLTGQCCRVKECMAGKVYSRKRSILLVRAKVLVCVPLPACLNILLAEMQQTKSLCGILRHTQVL